MSNFPKKKLIIRKGELRYTFITGKGVNRSDTDETKVYRTTLVYPNKEACDEYIEELENLWKESGIKGKPDYLGFRELLDENDEPTGEIAFKPWTNAYNESTEKQVVIPVYDAQGKKVPNPERLRIGNGSIGSVAVTAKPYQTKTAKGVTIYLNAIQLLKYVEYDGGINFGEDEGEFTAQDDFEADNSNQDVDIEI